MLSGGGFEDGNRTTVGASRKGRIWSHRRDRVDQLAAWCKSIGTKLLDENIDPEEVLKGTLEAKAVTLRPALMPITVDWPEEVYTTAEMLWSIVIGDEEYPLSELDLEIVSPSVDGPLRFKIVAEDQEAELELHLFENQEGPNYRFVVQGAVRVQVRRGERADADDATDFFYEDPPMIWFSDGSALEGNDFIPLKTAHPPYDAAKIAAWDWTGINIKKESQGKQKEADSIQAKVIATLMTGDYDVVIDDDGKGEAADVVTIKLIGDIGTHGRTGLGKLLLGSVAEEIFRTVPCPVLTVGPQADMPNGSAGKFRTILYATDFSSESLGATAYAVSLAQEFQSRLILLHVIAPQRAGDLVSAADLMATSQKLLRQTVSPEAQLWCNPEYQVVEGNSAEQILEFAKLREPDFIVLGARQHEGVPGAASHLPFATAHRVVTHAACPVLTVRH